MIICKKCNKYEVTYRHECKICGFKKRRSDLIDSVLSNGTWSLDEIETILYNILYEKVSVVNEIVPLLENKTLDDLLHFLTEDFKIGGQTRIRAKVFCSVCGKDEDRPIKLALGERVYCNMDCRNKGKTIFGVHRGDRNSRYNSKFVKCTNCNNEFMAPKYIQEQTNSYGENHHFCCQECYWKFRSTHYVKEKNGNYQRVFSEEERRRMSILTTKRICNGEFKQTQTKPHIKINDVLSSIGIEYENEYNCKYHSLDIYLSKNNLGIEIMGDYWHGNPIKYKDKTELGKIQLKGIKQDKSKHTYVAKYHNFEILYLWEYDINNNIDICKELIRLYIDRNGILSDYNSFNYYVNNNGNLSIKENIIQPYFLIKNP